ncbi:MAG: DUF4249 family protein [Bacteroidales bacterium]|nr:DUF4249 family protein [Bacteroidales bacterium]
MKTIKLIAITIVLFLAFSCQKIESVSEFTPDLVVEAYLIPGQSPVIKLSVETPYDSANAADLSVDDLEVVLKSEDNEFVCTSMGEGNYAAPESFFVEIQHTYQLEILFNDEMVSSQTFVPSKPIGYSSSETSIYLSSGTSGGGFGTSGFTSNINLYWQNPENDYFLVIVENIETNPEPIRDTDEERKLSFRNEPVQTEGDQIRPNSFQFFGTHRVILYKLNPEYSLLYEDSGSSSQNMTNPITNIENGYGIFTGINSDTLFIEVYKAD